MADKKIPALTAATTPLAGSEVLPIFQGSSTVKVSVANLTAGRSTSASEFVSDDGVQGRWTIIQEAAGNRLYSTTPGFGGWRTGAIQANGTGPNMTWASDGNTTVGVGNLVIGTAGKGIDFSANTHAAGMTSELLDWYEEGVWTPSDASGAGLTFTVIRGRYTRVGRQVFCSGLIVYPSTASGSTALLGGLPFTSANPFGGGFTGDGGYFTFQTNNAVTNLAVNPNATTVNLYTNTGGTVANSALSLSTLGFAIQYEAA